MEIVEIWVRDVPVGANMVCPLVCHSSGTSCHLLYKRRLSQIVSSLEEMPGRAEESARANMIRPLVCHSSGTSCHLLYKRRLSQIVSSLEEMPGRAEESARANTVRPYGGIGILHILHGFRFTIPCRDRCPHLSAVTSYPFHTRRDKRRTLFYFDSSADHSVISPV